MKTLLSALLLVTLTTGTAFAEWTLRNDDDASYELLKQCGSKTEDWSVAGGVTKKLSIPAGATSCTITVKKTKTSCTVKDGETCTIDGSGKISKR
ncbi:MAG: hypothetical protein M3680_36485 [Myxococcota bacterium]|nr:hypothetical protein [Myxococcota bacterium]